MSSFRPALTAGRAASSPSVLIPHRCTTGNNMSTDLTWDDDAPPTTVFSGPDRRVRIGLVRTLVCAFESSFTTEIGNVDSASVSLSSNAPQSLTHLTWGSPHMFQPTYVHHDKVLTVHLDPWRVLVCKMHEPICGIRSGAGGDGTWWMVETGEHRGRVVGRES